MSNMDILDIVRVEIEGADPVVFTNGHDQPIELSCNPEFLMMGQRPNMVMIPMSKIIVIYKTYLAKGE